MRKRTRLVWSVCLITLGGCAYVPHYERPAAPVAAQWPHASSSSGMRAATGLTRQQFLPDPRLQALITAALEHNRDLRIAVARVAEARALYGIIDAERLPALNLGASSYAARTPGDLSPTGQALDSRRQDVNLALPAFEIDFWNRVKNLSESAKASYLATEEAREAFRLSLVADVTSAYLLLQELDERATLASAALRTRAESRNLMFKRRELGLAGDLDYLSADGAYESSRVELASLERGLAQAANALTLLVGAMPGNQPAGQRLTEQDMAADLAVAIPSEALLSRPDVRAAEQKLIAANANIGAARAAFFPRIHIALGLGSASRSLSGLFAAGSGVWNFTPSLTLPLFDAGRAQANTDLAEARKVIAVAEYERTIQQAFREVADLLAARETLGQQLKAQETAETIQNNRRRIADARYLAGVSSYLEVLDAQREAFAAQQGTVQLRRAVLTARAQLYKALGGGRE